MASLSTSKRTRVNRSAARGVYDRDTVYAILDAGFICHVAYVEEGEPRMIPTAYMRRDDAVYLHGNRQSSMLRALGAGGMACINVTLVDGLVVARSGFHCSMNYRSVVIYGHAEALAPGAANDLLDAFVDALIPGHRDAVRAPTRQELAATTIVKIPIEDASAKVRTGDPIDPEEDLALPTWAGVVPCALRFDDAIPSGNLRPDVDLPDYIARIGR